MITFYIIAYILSYIGVFITAFGWSLAETHNVQKYYKDNYSYKKDIGIIFLFHSMGSTLSFIWLIAVYFETGCAHYGWTLKLKNYEQ